MQYLNDQQGNTLGVFISLPEWESIQEKLSLSDRDVWLHACVERGLAEMEAGNFAPEERITKIFHRMGTHAD